MSGQQTGQKDVQGWSPRTPAYMITRKKKLVTLYIKNVVIIGNVHFTDAIIYIRNSHFYSGDQFMKVVTFTGSTVLHLFILNYVPNGLIFETLGI